MATLNSWLLEAEAKIDLGIWPTSSYIGHRRLVIKGLTGSSQALFHDTETKESIAIRLLYVHIDELALDSCE